MAESSQPEMMPTLRQYRHLENAGLDNTALDNAGLDNAGLDNAALRMALGGMAGDGFRHAIPTPALFRVGSYEISLPLKRSHTRGTRGRWASISRMMASMSKVGSRVGSHVGIAWRMCRRPWHLACPSSAKIGAKGS